MLIDRFVYIKKIADPCDLDPDNHFRCSVSGNCIILKWKCDGDYDCGANDQSDEEQCDLSKYTNSYID